MQAYIEYDNATKRVMRVARSNPLDPATPGRTIVVMPDYDENRLGKYYKFESGQNVFTDLPE